MNIVLLGMPRCGKTKIGKVLAKKLKKKFIDTDLLVEDSFENAHGKKLFIKEMFTRYGESFFRTLEYDAILTLKNVNNSVISLGGGALFNNDVFDWICHIGCVVFLDLDPKLLFERLLVDMPAYLSDDLQKREFEDLLNTRYPGYVKACDYQIKLTSDNALEAVDSILHRISNIEEMKIGK